MCFDDKFYAVIRQDGEVTALLTMTQWFLMQRRPSFEQEGFIKPDTVAAGWFTKSQLEQQIKLVKEMEAVEVEDSSSWWQKRRKLYPYMTDKQIRQHLRVMRQMKPILPETTGKKRRP